jgi:hypothetical protein
MTREVPLLRERTLMTIHIAFGATETGRDGPAESVTP